MSSSSYNNSETNYPTSQDNTVYFATEEQDNIPSSASSFDGASVTAANVFAPSEGAVKYPDASSLDKPPRHNLTLWPFIAVCA